MKIELEVGDIIASANIGLGQEFRKFIISTDVLLKALEEDSIRELVRESLRKDYGSNTTFEIMVTNVTISLLKILSEAVRASAKSDKICVFLNNKRIETDEKTFVNTVPRFDY